jgi:polyisoprenoid-binding protein YceI
MTASEPAPVRSRRTRFMPNPATTRENIRPRRRNPLVLLAVLVLLGAVAAGAYGIWYLFLQGPGPAAVGGNASLAPIPSSAANASISSGGFDGAWKVDTSIGSISDFSGSFVGYRVQEELSGIGAQTAVGRTPDVNGSMTIAGNQVTAVEITANLTTLKSDDDRRDGQLQRQGIQTSQFPTATFTLSEPISGTIPAEGVEVNVTAKGKLTLHGVTRNVEIPLKAKWSGSVIQIAGSTEIVFADYNIRKPSSFLVLSIADTGTLELQLFFTKA